MSRKVYKDISFIFKKKQDILQTYKECLIKAYIEKIKLKVQSACPELDSGSKIKNEDNGLIILTFDF